MIKSLLHQPLSLLCFLALGSIFLFTQCQKDENLSASENNPSFNSSNPTNSIFNDESNVELSDEGYNEIEENPWLQVSDAPTSTFSIDADGAAYSNMRRYLTIHEQLPPKDAIRTEEFINYFTFDYPNPSDNHPISLNGEMSSCPWADGHQLLRIGIRGKDIPQSELPSTNFVYLIDVSGSMNNPEKLGLLKESFVLFTDQLRPEDRVAIVTYAGNAGVILDSTPGTDKQTIKSAINSLGAGGSTAGAEGIITAYEIAEANFIEGGNNRIIIGTDGDFNVGPSTQDELVTLIEEKRENGVFITVLGVGTGNLQDGQLEQIANNGNGNYEYIDNLEQAKKIFLYEFNKFYTVAKDVKIQIEFDEEQVEAYRLIGYENRLLNNEDFEDDEKDAGEIGSNQTITALYELILKDAPSDPRAAITVDFRYKMPNEDTSIPMELGIYNTNTSFANASENTRFAAVAAGFGLVLRDSEFKGTLNYDKVLEWAQGAVSFDPHGFRVELVTLIEKAKTL